MFEPGIYSGTFVSGKAGRKGESELIECAFKVVSIARDGKWAAVAPVEVTVPLYLTAKAKEFTIPKLVALGFNGNFKAVPLGFGKLGQPINLICAHELYREKTREKWELHGWGKTEAEDLSDAQTTQLNAWWQTVAPTPAPEEPAAAPAPNTAPAPPTGDDIPF